ncbi:MAG: hypothetical protein U0414_14295 [Polyangiaceae bacterium]
MQQFARLKFTSYGLSAPQDWSLPSGVSEDHYRRAFKPEELATAILAPALVGAATANKYHTDTQKMLVDKIGAYLDGVTAAICSAWGQWQSTATLVGVMVNAVTASGGSIVGPPLGPLIRASAPQATPQEAKYSGAIADAIGMGWLSFTATVKVPGLPWYPPFAAFPGPLAPPVPNVPAPFVALTQVRAPIAAAALAGAMEGNLGDPAAPYHAQIFGAVADAFEKVFDMWAPSCMVTNVLGSGPVPTFAPPVVPAGPVVGGIANMAPGGFA